MTQIEISNGGRTLVVDAEGGEDLAVAIAEALQATRQAPSRVEITNGPHQIIIEADADMTDVIAGALQLYRDTDDDTEPVPGTTTISLGFHTAYAEPEPADSDAPEARRRNTRKAPLT